MTPVASAFYFLLSECKTGFDEVQFLSKFMCIINITNNIAFALLGCALLISVKIESKVN